MSGMMADRGGRERRRAGRSGAGGRRCARRGGRGCGGYEEFHPYGTTAVWAASASIEVSSKRYRYTGMERDDETGMQYHSARYYAPWLGRWTAVDPAGLSDEVNGFLYVGGRAALAVDPSGLGAVADDGAKCYYGAPPSNVAQRSFGQQAAFDAYMVSIGFSYVPNLGWRPADDPVLMADATGNGQVVPARNVMSADADVQLQKYDRLLSLVQFGPLSAVGGLTGGLAGGDLDAMNKAASIGAIFDVAFLLHVGGRVISGSKVVNDPAGYISSARELSREGTKISYKEGVGLANLQVVLGRKLSREGIAPGGIVDAVDPLTTSAESLGTIQLIGPLLGNPDLEVNLHPKGLRDFALKFEEKLGQTGFNTLAVDLSGLPVDVSSRFRDFANETISNRRGQGLATPNVLIYGVGDPAMQHGVPADVRRP